MKLRIKADQSYRIETGYPEQMKLPSRQRSGIISDLLEMYEATNNLEVCKRMRLTFHFGEDELSYENFQMALEHLGDQSLHDGYVEIKSWYKYGKVSSMKLRIKAKIITNISILNQLRKAIDRNDPEEMTQLYNQAVEKTSHEQVQMFLDSDDLDAIDRASETLRGIRKREEK